MKAANNNIYEQVYNAQDDDGMMSRLATVVLVLVQRGMLVAGFNVTKELLTLHYTGYAKNRLVWDINFFEHMFAQEPLLAAKDKVKGVFICSNKNLIIPDALYDENEAKNWLKHIFYVEQKDVIEAYTLEEDKARYILSAPMDISELVKINFRKAVVQPMAAYHFCNSTKQSLYLQCCITGEQVCATLHNYSQLLWHRVFDYTCAEDIAFEIRQLCMENNISPSKISLRCNTISATEHGIINELSAYFPGLRAGNGRSITANWDGAIYLTQQLVACV
ncbi:MAG: hypothetical protein K0Q79_2694 [Flavipsychrobacter sp.]|jgi:hypothetical protein|nr:hypothetical protein [Flavipsychrobacter sp.]